MTEEEWKDRKTRVEEINKKAKCLRDAMSENLGVFCLSSPDMYAAMRGCSINLASLDQFIVINK